MGSKAKERRGERKSKIGEEKGGEGCSQPGSLDPPVEKGGEERREGQVG